LTATVAVTAFFAFPLYLISENTGAEPGHTGGPFPGERTCGRAQCHNTTPDTGPGGVSVTANGAPLDQFRYTPGETVDLIVRIEDPDQGRWGFQITARSSDDGCRSEGSLAPAGGDNIRILEGIPVGPCSGPQYATHSFPPKLGPGSQEYNVSWTAPSTNVGPIMFAAAGNAANGNNQNTGDRIYTMQATVEPAVSEPPPPTPSISSGGVVLATLAPTVTRAAPNAIVSIFGQEFAPAGTQNFQPQLDGEGKVSTEMSGVCVEISGNRSPMFAVLPGQLNLQASDQLGPGPHAVTVIRNCGQPNEVRSQPEMVDFEAAAPGFFVFTSFGGADGANPIVAPNGLFADATPAAPGEFVSLFATGLGALEEPLAVGEIPNRQIRLAATARVTIGDIELPAEDIFYVGAAPCCAGLYQLVVRIPEPLGPGNHEVVMTIDGVPSPPGPFVPVE